VNTIAVLQKIVAAPWLAGSINLSGVLTQIENFVFTNDSPAGKQAPQARSSACDSCSGPSLRPACSTDWHPYRQQSRGKFVFAFFDVIQAHQLRASEKALHHG
jgi:hypothetical protein